MDNLPGWLTTVTARLGLDRLRAKTPVPVEEVDVGGTAADPADEVILADRVGIALQVVLDRLNPGERVAFILHDSFCVDFSTVAEVLGHVGGRAQARLRLHDRRRRRAGIHSEAAPEVLARVGSREGEDSR